MKFNFSEHKRTALGWLNAQRLIYVVSLGAIPAMLIGYVAYIYFLSPAYSDLAARRAVVEKKEAEVGRGLAVEAQEASFKNEFRRVVELFDESQPKIPQETGTSNILGFLQQLGARRNVKVTSLIASSVAVPSPNAPLLYERELPVTVTGNYDDVLRFWLDVSNLERILVVRDFSVQSAKLDAGRAARPKFVSVNFSLIAFHAPPSDKFPVIPAEMMPRSTVARNGE